MWPGCVRRRFLTFICGRAGVCALGAVIAKHCDDQLRVTQYLSSFDEVRLLTRIVPGFRIQFVNFVCGIHCCHVTVEQQMYILMLYTQLSFVTL